MRPLLPPFGTLILSIVEPSPVPQVPLPIEHGAVPRGPSCTTTTTTTGVPAAVCDAGVDDTQTFGRCLGFIAGDIQ